MNATKTKRPLRAILPEQNTCNGKNLSPDKELTDEIRVVVFDHAKRNDEYTSGISEPITARFWMARRSDGMSPVYCSVWLRSRDGQREFAGHGSAGGCGYHKASAALQEAFRSAGVAFKGDGEHFHGAGETAMANAIDAAAKALGYGRLPRRVMQ